jgi:hypothetical protein
MEPHDPGIDVPRKITPKFPDFQLQWIDAQTNITILQVNAHRARIGLLSQRNLLGSKPPPVFTHILPEAVENYLSGVARMPIAANTVSSHLCSMTNPQARLKLATAHSLSNNAFDNHHTVFLDVSELAALDEERVNNLYKHAGLLISRLDYGS